MHSTQSEARHVIALLLISVLGLTILSYLPHYLNHAWEFTDAPLDQSQRVIVGLLFTFFLAGLLMAFFRGWQHASTMGLSQRRVLQIGVVATGIAGAGLPLLSTDLLAYITYGRLWAIYDVNPYLVPPIDVIDVVFTQLTPARWSDIVAVYGPAGLLVSGGAAWIAGESILWNIVLAKGLAAGSVLLSIWIGARWIRAVMPTIDQTRALLFLAWNPLLLLEVAHQGHNDGLMVLAMIAGLYAWQQRQTALAVVAFTLGALVKLYAIFPLLFLLIWALRHRESTLLFSIRQVLVAICAGVVITVLLYAPFWEGWATLTNPMHQLGPSFATLTRSLAEGVYWAGGHFGPRIQAGLYYGYLTLGAILLACFLFRTLRIATALSQIYASTAGFLMLYLLVVCGWFQVWYLTWIIPFLIPIPRSPWMTIFLVYMIGALLHYALFLIHPSPVQEVVAIVVTNLAPLILLVLWWRGTPRLLLPLPATNGPPQ